MNAYTRVDEQGVPKIVQSCINTYDLRLEVKLFNGEYILLESDLVRDFSCKNLKKWDADKYLMASEYFIDKFGVINFLRSTNLLGVADSTV